jgi:hypothetical protein
LIVSPQQFLSAFLTPDALETPIITVPSRPRELCIQRTAGKQKNKYAEKRMRKQAISANNEFSTD